MLTQLPPVPSLISIRERLPEVFSEGTENRAYVTRDMAASTVFVMFYTGAIEGTGTWIRPDQVTKMSDSQAAKTDGSSRERWTQDSLVPGRMKSIRGRWYAANTREPIRDETLRMGLVQTGAVVERQGLPTTSAKPRYALNAEFAALFDERLSRHNFRAAARKWQENHLSPVALTRIRLRRRGALAATSLAHVLVTLPNGETRQMAPGPSSVLSKAVIEVFALRFLSEPAVVFLSESGNKIVSEDQRLASSLGLSIEPDRNLPDIILADIGLKKPLLIFIEVVITDGAITRPRKEALLSLAIKAGFPEDRVAFVTAFEDRSRPSSRRLSSELAWGTVAWFASEPERLVLLMEKAVTLDRLPYSPH
jgi:hypothetical protein